MKPIRRPQRAALLLALACIAGCNSTPDEQDPKELLAMHREFALRYYDENELDRAEQQVDMGLEIEPRDEKLRLMKGWIRQRRGTAADVFAAEEIFRGLLPSKDYRVLLGLGEALERKGVLYWESASAVEGGKRFTKASDPQARAKELRGDAQTCWRESLEHYEKALERKPGELQAINGMQRVYALRGEKEKALRWSQELLDKSAAEAEFWTRQLERPDLSADEEARLRALLAGSEKLQIETHLQASTLLAGLDRPAEALEHLDRVLELDPEQAEVHSRRAQLLHRLGRIEEAIASLENYLRFSEGGFDHPDVARAMDLLARWKGELDAQASDGAN